jgi:hypothetical protein
MLPRLQAKLRSKMDSTIGRGVSSLDGRPTGLTTSPSIMPAPASQLVRAHVTALVAHCYLLPACLAPSACLMSARWLLLRAEAGDEFCAAGGALTARSEHDRAGHRPPRG